MEVIFKEGGPNSILVNELWVTVRRVGTPYELTNVIIQVKELREMKNLLERILKEVD